jgi:hypothetical protein
MQEGLRSLQHTDRSCRNEAWVVVSLIAGSLTGRRQITGFEGALAKAEPKTICCSVLHRAALSTASGMVVASLSE